MTSDEITNASSGQIADMLTEYNNWRRGKPPYDEPCSLNLSAYELGLCLDRAIEILRGESLNTKSPENENSEKVVYNGAKMREALRYLRDASREFYHLILNSKHNEICDKYKYAPSAKISDAIANANATLAEPSEPIGNNQKMREALKDVAEQIQDEAKWADEMSYQQAIALGIIQSALAEPARNCDIGTAEEQDQRFETFCGKYNCVDDPKCSCPCLHISAKDCRLIWAQMPYEKGGAE